MTAVDGRIKLAFLAGLLIYVIYFCGFILLWSGTIDDLARRLKLRRRLTGRRSAEAVDHGMVRLTALCVLVFVAGFAAALGSFRLFASLLIALMSGSLPALIYLIKRGSDRKKGSREGVGLVTELHRQYRIQGGNIYEAMDAVIASGGDYPVSRKLLSVLLLRLRDAGSRDAVKAACARFAASSGSMWGRMLATSIETAVLTGADITASVADIAQQLKSAQKLSEERRRLNSESVRMTVFLVPLLYAGTMMVASRFLGVELSDLLRNQFASPEGLALLLVCVFLFLVDLVILQAVENSGADY